MNLRLCFEHDLKINWIERFSWLCLEVKDMISIRINFVGEETVIEIMLFMISGDLGLVKLH